MSVQVDVRKAFIKVREIFGELTGVAHVATRQNNTRFSALTESDFMVVQNENVES
jgi:hypothetical protein